MDARPPTRVLVAVQTEHEFDRVCELLHGASGASYQLDWTSTYDAALARLAVDRFDAAVVAHSLGDQTGLDLLRVAGDRPGVPPLILLTDRRDGDVDSLALDAGAADHLDIPGLTSELLDRAIRHAIKHREAVDEARRREAHFRAIIEHSGDGVATVDRRGAITYSTPAITRMLGYEGQNLLDRTYHEFVHPDDAAAAGEAFDRSVAVPGIPVRTRVRVRHRTGGWRLLEAVIVNRLADPAIGSIVCNCTDVTDRARIEQVLEEQGELFRAVFSGASDAIVIADDDGRFVTANHAAALLFGIDLEALLRTPGRDFMPPAVAHEPAWRDFLRAGRLSGAYRLVRADGTAREVEFAAVANVLPGRHLSILRDVTERKEAADALGRTEARLRALFESNIVNITFGNQRGDVLDANDAFLQMVGRSRAELEAGAITWPSVTPPEFIDVNARAQEDIRRTGTCLPFEKQYERPDGTRVWAQVSVARLPGTADETVALSVDITRQKAIETALVESERKFSTIFASSPLAIVLSEIGTGRIVEANPAFTELTGFSRDEIIGRTALELGVWIDGGIPESTVARIEKGEAVRNVEARIRHKSGAFRHVLLSIDHLALPGASDLYMALVADVTDRHLLEDQLRQAQKMEAIGRLAGGIAHDFNNLLTVILGYVDLIDQHPASNADIRADVDEVRKAATSAAGLTRQLLAFSRRQVLQPRRLDPNDAVSQVESMLRRVLGEDIALRTALARPIGTVLADAAQLQHVLMNLAVNARDAMPSGGQFTIETANVVLDSSYVDTHPEASPGPHVMLAISDTGVGMDDAVKSHLFEPFFTTKEPGRGTGLGLATVYGVITQMGGSIRVFSERGHGTTFTIHLPAVEGGRTEAVAAPTPVALAGTECVLLVEDQPEVRRVTAQILRRHGYTVLESPGPREAIAAAGAQAEHLDLLLTDVVMPEMSGRQLARELHATRPAMRVLYASGYTDDAIVHHGVLDPGLAFVQKPFTPQELLRKVREVLDAPTAPSV